MESRPTCSLQWRLYGYLRASVGAVASVSAAPTAPSRAPGPDRWTVSRRSFCHELLLYTDGEVGFVRAAVPHIRSALAADAPVLVAVAGERIAALRQALAEDAERVRFADMRSLGQNPARIIPLWQDFLGENAGVGDALGVGEPIWPGRSQAELDECERHEALLNVAFEPGPGWRLLCPYDLDALEGPVIEAARRSHPHLAGIGSGCGNDGYLCGSEAPDPLAGALPAPSGPVRELAFTRDDLGALRRFLSEWATRELLDVERTEELVLVLNELATNSVSYGGGTGALRVWREGETLLCEVGDAGHIADPLVGRTRPRLDERSGRGLWLANQLCDLMQIRSTPAGSVVRVHKRLA